MYGKIFELFGATGLSLSSPLLFNISLEVYNCACVKIRGFDADTPVIFLAAS